MTIHLLFRAKVILAFIFCTFLSQISYSQKIVAGFFGDWHTVGELNAVQFDKLTDIYYAFLKSDNNGNASPTTAGGLTTILSPMVTKAHAQGVRCHVSLGGATTSDNLGIVIGNTTSRNNLVNSIRTIIQNYNLDGFNMDWEFPASGDAANLAQFMISMRAAMDALETTMGKKLYLTAAVGPLLWNTDGINSTFINQCDYIYVMAFDAGGSCCVCDPNNHSSMNIAKWSVEKWTNAGLPWATCGGSTAAKNAPASKIVLSIPFYSQSGKYKNFSAADPAAYYNDADGILGGHGYNSRPLIEQKVDYIMNTIGGAGVWCWELPDDRNDQYSLLNVMWTKMQPYMCPIPQPDLGADKSICGVTSVTLNSGVGTTSGRTFSWKRNGSAITGSSPSLTVTTVGTYEVMITQNGCTKTDQVVVSSTLSAPDFSSVPSNLCAILPYTLTPSNLSSFPSGTTWQWQKDGSNISGATSSSLSGIKTAGVYRLTANAGSCTSNATKTLTSSLPTPVDGTGPSGSAIPLSITNATGGPYTWHTAATGGTQVATGTSYSPVLTSTTTYYVQDGATTSFYVGPAGPATNWEIAASDANYINFTVSSTNATIAEVDVYVAGWVNVSSVVVKIWNSSGSLLFTSPSASYNNSSSSARVKLTVPVGYNAAPGSYRLSVQSVGALVTNALPTFPITNSNVSLTGVGGTLGAYPFAMNWKIGGGSNCARLPVTATVTAAVAQPVVTSPVTYCQNASAVALTATPSSGGTLRWYGTNATGGTASTTAPIPSTSTQGTTSYYVSQVIGGTESTRAKIDVTVNTVPTISSTTPNSRCGTGTVVLGATASAGTLNWYNVATNGTSLGTGTSYTTPSISSTTNYYVSATNAGCTSARTLVIATVNTIPAVSSTTPNSRCGTGTVVLGATASAGTLNWYNVATNGTSLGTGTSYTTPSISSTTNYYVSATNAGCTSARTLVIATVNTIPTVSSTTPNSRCGTGTVVLGATASAGTLNWYNVATNGTSLGTGTSYTTPSISSTTNYYVSATNAGCTSTRTMVIATVNQTVAPTVAISASQTTICPGTSVTFTATPGNGGSSPSYQWKRNNVNVGANSPTLTTSTINNGDVFTVVLTSNAVCVSPAIVTSSGVTMTVSSTVVPTISVSASQTTICPGTSVTFTATPGNGGSTPSYQWKRNNVNVGTNSSTLTTSNINNGDVFTAVLTSNAACISQATATSSGIMITVNTTPSAPSGFTTSSANVGQGQTGVLYSVTSVSGADNYTWSYSGIGAIINGDGPSVSIDFSASSTSGVLSVAAKNTCGNSAPVTLSITVNTSSTPHPGDLTVYTNPVFSGSSGIMYCVINEPGTTYNWNYSGTGATINGNGSNCITIDYSNSATSGTLSVIATNGNNPPSSPSSLEIEVKTATGVKVPLEGVILKAYPNPFENTSTIHIELTSGAEVDMEVYNVYGVKVETLKQQEYLSSGIHEVMIGSLANGIYFVKLKIGERDKTIKLVKQ